MITSSSCSSFTPVDLNITCEKCLFLRTRSSSLLLLHISPTKRCSNKNLIIRNTATPEAAVSDLVSSSGGDDVLSSLSLPTVPGVSDSLWIAGIAGLIVGVPLLLGWLLTLTKEVDMTTDAVEKIADAVGKVAEEVDEAAEELGEALPEGGLKQVVSFVEDLAEETTKEAQKVEDLMNKVEELDEKLEQILEKESEGTEKA